MSKHQNRRKDGRNIAPKTQASGRLSFENTRCVVDDMPVQASGDLVFNNQKIDFQSFTVKGIESDVQLTGSLDNWLALFSSDDQQTTDAIISAEIASNNLNLGKVLAFASAPEAPKSYGYATKGLPTPQYRKQFPLLNHLSGRLITSVKHFQHKKIIGRDFKGTLELAGNDLILRGAASAMQGGWLIDGKMDLGYRPHLFAKLTTSGVNMTEFFNQTDNFGQNILRKENISGRLTSRMAINAFWDEHFKFDLNKLHVLADVALVNGELVGFKMLEKFSNFVKVKDLQHIKFTNLSNQLEIYRRTIHIPLMFVQTNALNLQVSGEHTFDQKLNYNLSINAGQVLMNRFKLFNSRLDPQPDRRNGWFTLYYNIGGSVQNPTFAQDKEGVRMAFLESENKLTDMRARLSRSFNIQFSTTDKRSDAVAQLPQASPFPNKKPINSKQTEDDSRYLPGF
ncbi:MAG: AsmA-like C-terminal region-containing protein [Saprospiraceae bacterium]|nr:AsmA-like C-terminal region-containing protein [Saprospiraceae bacterium]